MGAAIKLDCIVREIKYYDAKEVHGYNLTVPVKVVFEKNGWLLTIIDSREWHEIQAITAQKLTDVSCLYVVCASKTHNYGTRSKSFHTNQLRTQDEQFMYDIGEDKFIEIKEKIK